MTTKVSTTELAKEFSQRVFYATTPEQHAAILAHPLSDDACITHDFIDPNQSMVDAITSLTGDDFDFPEDIPMINEAWTIARANNWFQPTK